MDNNNAAVIKGEIDVRSLIMRVFIKWRLFLIIAALCAALVGFYSLYSQKKAVREWDASEEISDSEEVPVPDYTYVRERTLQAIKEKSDYFKNSIYMRLDSSAVGKAYVDIYVETDALLEEKSSYLSDETNRNTVYVTDAYSPAVREAHQILDHYTQFMTRGIDYSELASEMNTSPQYVRELLNIAAVDGDVLRAIVSVNYFDVEGAEKILNYIIQSLEVHYPEAAEEFGEHRLVFRDRYSQYIADTTTLSTIVATRVSEFNNLMKQYNDLKSYQSSLDTSLAEKAAAPEVSMKTAVKKAVIGFVGGLILSIGIYLLLLLASSRILSARDINSLYGLRKLGVIPKETDKKIKGIDKWILSSELRYQSNPDHEKSFAVADGNVKSVLGEGNRVVIVSDLEISELDELKEKLSSNDETIVYSIAGDLSEPSARKAFDECDGVVVAARVMKSRYRMMNDLMQEVVHSGKPVLGSIVF